MKRKGEFSVYQFFDDELYERVEQFVDPQTAVEAARRLINSVGARVGTTQKVIITDGGDYTNFEWRFGVGIVYPIDRGEETYSGNRKQTD